MAEPSALKTRVLVVDDSAYNRQTITTMLETLPGVEVVGRAMNGKEALQLCFDLEPDVITLDLEMPEMDGFSFLRLLMARRPTPVLVVSGYAQRENVFRALELGALDFLAKPGREISPDLKSIEQELVAKMSMVRKLQAVRLQHRARALAALAKEVPPAVRPRATKPAEPPRGAIGIAASTGGPPAVQQLLAALDPTLPVAIFIAQHMPARFTRAFAQRLDRIVGFNVQEAMDGQPVTAGSVYVAPGASNLEVAEQGGRLVTRLVPPGRGAPGPVLTPSADHLFTSLAHVFGTRLVVSVLTGMGSDGRDGARIARDAGAHVIAEDPKTAVMPGMPHSVVEAGVTHEVLPVEAIADAMRRALHSRIVIATGEG
jgi:two-component system chemotaxis response regulator CheB